ncbi:MAG TPA: hypothetical protein VJA94_08235, partial [Candidatus Angelobacter sp.]
SRRKYLLRENFKNQAANGRDLPFDAGLIRSQVAFGFGSGQRLKAKCPGTVDLDFAVACGLGLAGSWKPGAGSYSSIIGI